MQAVIATQSGLVQGYVNDGVLAVKGIPFAKPLHGAKRWLAPEAAAPWKACLNCETAGPIALQNFEKYRPKLFANSAYLKAIGPLASLSEGAACLNLAVWTPAPKSNAKLAVMVYIHGGAYDSGSAYLPLYDGQSLAKRGVVVVNIQYRLGAEGFMHFDGMVDGQPSIDNRGFLDMILGLQWVRDNIEAFGGDSENVTIFGESAGACAVYALAASPMAKGLFKRVIAMSGIPEAGAEITAQHSLSKACLVKLGLSLTDLATLSIDQHRALTALYTKPFGLVGGDLSVFKSNPLRAKGYASGGDFMPKPVLEIFAEGTPNNVDMMLGTTSNDGGLFTRAAPLPSSLASRIMVKLFPELHSAAGPKAMFAEYRKAMKGATGLAIRERMLTEMVFRQPTLAAAIAHAKAHSGRTWLYQFDVASDIPGVGAIHGADCPMVFDNVALANGLFNNSPKNHQTADFVCAAFVNFAKTGNPNHGKLAEWKPFDKERRPEMVFRHLSA
ncbi:carboxylesterase type B [Zhongshania antarctica]|uniref:Carboxylic ester hydrolase n=1 Tax=Zhongshania antarctica TaxID=641702 RepID=A0A840R3U7_9GAMM|nr:carboxylesterase family protein [Zhongshania antarctica]MBB5187467.1 carboxylesterase type B [Zhongshania antarctica]